MFTPPPAKWVYKTGVVDGRNLEFDPFAAVCNRFWGAERMIDHARRNAPGAEFTVADVQDFALTAKFEAAIRCSKA
jgi:hypothetical protein